MVLGIVSCCFASKNSSTATFNVTSLGNGESQQGFIVHLVFQIENLEEDLAKSRKEAAEGEQAKQTLVETSKKLREWENASLQLLTPQERLAVGESPIGIDMFRQKVAYCQQEMITCAEEIHSLKAR